MSEHDDEARDYPADLAAIQADDALLDTLSGSPPTFPPADEPVANVLLQWRREIDAEPVPELVDTDTAMKLMADARRPAPRRRPVLMPFAAAAAMLVIAFSGVGLAAKSAQPEDRLFGVTQVLYPEYAGSVEAATAVERDLAEAAAALKEGRSTDAEAALDRAEQHLSRVKGAEERDELVLHRETLRSELAEKSGAGSDPSSGSTSESSDSAESSDRVEQLAPDDEPDSGDSESDSDSGDSESDSDSGDSDSDSDSGDSDSDSGGEDARDDPSTRSRPSEDGSNSNAWPTPTGGFAPSSPIEAPPTT
ncbi:MAG: hypothetical protein GEU83_06735 [Pseudonocardiaceae bacterium]|nr:hypothetical protein [Pseudonocardiaceae bacterium]